MDPPSTWIQKISRFVQYYILDWFFWSNRKAALKGSEGETTKDPVCKELDPENMELGEVCAEKMNRVGSELEPIRIKHSHPDLLTSSGVSGSFGRHGNQSTTLRFVVYHSSLYMEQFLSIFL